jgi:hypothetical protein
VKRGEGRATVRVVSRRRRIGEGEDSWLDLAGDRASFSGKGFAWCLDRLELVGLCDMRQAIFDELSEMTTHRGYHGKKAMILWGSLS